MSAAGLAWRPLALLLALAAPVAFPPAVVAAPAPAERLADPTLERRARDISAELRCLVCQNQSIDDSDAELAQDLRRVVRERLTLGESDGDIRRFVVDRYGDFILLRPPFRASTSLLWLGPFAVLLLGAAALVWRLRRPAPAVAMAGLSATEQAELEAVLAGGDRTP